ncbi:hypothetical protein ASE28_21680 [Acidovorax sp. Root219]|nr:hypothetical protein ASE28_21680 [Acidovorax sp. Root219]
MCLCYQQQRHRDRCIGFAVGTSCAFSPQHGPKLIGNTHQLAVAKASWKDCIKATGLKDFFQVHLAEMADLFFV